MTGSSIFYMVAIASVYIRWAPQSAETHAVLLSCHSWNIVDGFLLSSETLHFRYQTRCHQTLCRLLSDTDSGLKMVIKVYIASSTGSVAVSAHKPVSQLVDGCMEGNSSSRVRKRCKSVCSQIRQKCLMMVLCNWTVYVLTDFRVQKHFK